VNGVELLQIAGPILGAVVLGGPLGLHLAKVWTGEPTILDPVLAPAERALRRAFGMDPKRGRGWVGYALAVLAFNGVAFVGLYAWLRLQSVDGGGPSPDAAFWFAWANLTEFQPYPGVTGAGFGDAARVIGVLAGVFVAGGSGLTVAATLTRAIARPREALTADFWLDLTRNDLYLLLPVFAVTVGVLMVSTAVAPTADWARSAIVAVSVNAVRFACAFAFGRLVRARAEGYALAFVMALVTGLAAWLGDVASRGESSTVLSGDRVALATTLVIRTLQGGAGPGFASLLVIALLAVCLGGMLVGRTPEYLGKRLGATEIKLATLASLALWAVILAAAAAAGVLSDALRRHVGLGAWSASYEAAFGDVASAVVMAVGRFGALIPVLAIAGALAAKPRRAATAGTAGSGGLIFLGLFVAVAMLFIAVRLTPPLAHIGPQSPVHVSPGAIAVHGG
jgi:K+-transporting ATPase ATPase A chain